MQGGDLSSCLRIAFVDSIFLSPERAMVVDSRFSCFYPERVNPVLHGIKNLLHDCRTHNNCFIAIDTESRFHSRRGMSSIRLRCFFFGRT